ncbi:hypothetical protein [Micromonospora sp. NPDC023814]
MAPQPRLSVPVRRGPVARAFRVFVRARPAPVVVRSRGFVPPRLFRRAWA